MFYSAPQTDGLMPSTHKTRGRPPRPEEEKTFIERWIEQETEGYESVASRVDVTVPYLQAVAAGWQPASRSIMTKLGLLSGGKIKPEHFPKKPAK